MTAFVLSLQKLDAPTTDNGAAAPSVSSFSQTLCISSFSQGVC